MRVRFRRVLGAGFLAGSLSLGLVSCSSQEQQADDQVVEGNEYADQEGYEEEGQQQQYESDEEYANQEEGDGEGYEAQGQSNYGEEVYSGEVQAEQDELQEIIDGMNQQQSADVGVGEYAEGNLDPSLKGGTTIENEAIQGETLNAEGFANTESAGFGNYAAPVEQQTQFGGGTLGSGLPELGSKMSYVVGRGDTLASIAMKIYGNNDKWVEIAEFTGMANPDRIYPGDVVYYQLTEATSSFAGRYESMGRSEVVVQPGDTLSTIASQVLGSPSDWKMIWRQNDTIDNPDVLIVGQTIYYQNPNLMSTGLDSLDAQSFATNSNSNLDLDNSLQNLGYPLTNVLTANELKTKNNLDEALTII